MEILFAVLLVVFLSALDQTIVGVALPRIVGELGGTNELYTWVITSYLLAATITGVFYGKLSDIYGRRLMLLFGVSVFLLGSFLSALSWSMESLILFRGIQGVGAGAIFPISLAIIGDLFTPRERGRYQGLFGAVFGIASVIGPLLGGWLTDNLSWHWIFLVNLPIGAVTLVIVYRYLPSVHGEPPTRNLDYLGAVVFAVGGRLPAPGPDQQAVGRVGLDFEVGGYLLIAAVVGAIFLFIERRAAEPIVPLELFRNRNYAVTIAGHLPGLDRLLRGHHLPAALVPVRAGASARPSRASRSCRCWPASSPAPSAAGILVSRTGTFRWHHRRCAGHHGRGPAPLHEPARHAPTCPCCGRGCSSSASASDPRCRSSPSSSRPPCPSAASAWPPATWSSSARSAARSAWPSWAPSSRESFASRLQPSLVQAGVPVGAGHAGGRVRE